MVTARFAFVGTVARNLLKSTNLIPCVAALLAVAACACIAAFFLSPTIQQKEGTAALANARHVVHEALPHAVFEPELDGNFSAPLVRFDYSGEWSDRSAAEMESELTDRESAYYRYPSDYDLSRIDRLRSVVFYKVLSRTAVGSYYLKTEPRFQSFERTLQDSLRNYDLLRDGPLYEGYSVTVAACVLSWPGNRVLAVKHFEAPLPKSVNSFETKTRGDRLVLEPSYRNSVLFEIEKWVMSKITEH